MRDRWGYKGHTEGKSRKGTGNEGGKQENMTHVFSSVCTAPPLHCGSSSPPLHSPSHFLFHSISTSFFGIRKLLPGWDSRIDSPKNPSCSLHTCSLVLVVYYLSVSKDCKAKAYPLCQSPLKLRHLLFLKTLRKRRNLTSFSFFLPEYKTANIAASLKKKKRIK